jgi:hypothetical protein
MLRPMSPLFRDTLDTTTGAKICDTDQQSDELNQKSISLFMAYHIISRLA